MRSPADMRRPLALVIALAIGLSAITYLIPIFEEIIKGGKYAIGQRLSEVGTSPPKNLITNTSVSFSLTIGEKVLWFDFGGVKALTTIEEMLFNVPRRPKLSKWAVPIIGSLIVNLSTNMEIECVRLEFFHESEREWFFIDYGDYVLNTSYTYVLLDERPGCAYAIDNLIPGLSYRLVVALRPLEGIGEDAELEEGQVLYSNGTITAVYTSYPEETLLVYLENITLPTVEFRILSVEATSKYLVLVLEHVGSLPLIFNRKGPSINLVLPYGAGGVDIVKVAELERKISPTHIPLPAHVEYIRGGHDVWLPKPWEEYMASVLLPGEKLELKIEYGAALHGKVLIEVPGDKVAVDIGG